MTSYFFSVANGALWSAIRLAWIYSLCICSKPLLYTKSFIISVNCQWSSWNHYSGCTKSCGGGTQFKTRIKTIPESDGGSCFGEKVYSRNCNIQNCPGKFNKVEFMFLLTRNIISGAENLWGLQNNFFSHCRSEQFW